MELVVDANIVIAALISPRGHTADLFFAEGVELYAPEFLLEEIEEHKDEILSKTGFSEQECEQALAFLAGMVRFVPLAEFLQFIPRAREIAPDQDDAAYFALALQQRCALWSNDARLKSQPVIKVLNTFELIHSLY